MVTKLVRSRFSHEVGEKVEGCTIVEVRVIIPPDPSQNRRGVYDYVVEAPPMAAAAPRETHSTGRKKAAPSHNVEPARDSYVRSTPEEMGGRLIRRVPSR
jgi:hypothetical protein